MRTTILVITIFAAILSFSCQQTEKKGTDQLQSVIKQSTIEEVTNELTKAHPEVNQARIARGVEQTASLWFPENGDSETFANFCKNNFIADKEARHLAFEKLSRNFEILDGHFNKISLELLEPLHLDMGDITKVDQKFGSYSAGAHVKSDLYKNKIAFMVTLNFPQYTLAEKNKLGANWTRKEWAYARMGDRFTARVPAKMKMNYSETETAADMYIADYNIFAGQLFSEKGEKLFPEGMKLLSHWNIRDEIKSNYADKNHGLEKQRTLYRVMKRIVDQSIPETVINNDKPEWNPFTNKITLAGEPKEAKAEPNTRYQHMLNLFHAVKAMDKYYPTLDTYIKRKFSGSMEISQEETEKLFVEYMSSPVLKDVGALISKRLGRDLEPFDIWYDGFKTRSSLDQDKLNEATQQWFPNAMAMENELPNILKKLGFPNDRATYLSNKIAVDPARGSGHAWGASMKGEKAHLRTRIPESGMNYKGYNIAIHEFGHNVEQTISLYDVDYYTLNGVPNTGFTEALAFMFQSRDLEILGMATNNANKEHLKTLDKCWGLFEIMGVGLVDQRVWKWLYANPDATAADLKKAVMRISKEVWNEFYAPVFGQKDETLQGIYSHMIASPLYLSAYSFGQIIEFQLEEHIANKDFASEVQRIFQQGRLTPNQWMMEAVGEPLSVQPILNKTEKALKALN
ncbi:hypothetical protein L21SP5_01142 [Salinivirga cyanobacteriivorans]|uniref:Uncharacterized protein n=1 Tax=Salinivirga cyanobacteriivorans TaxID=1307839 RepID=A0A0S2HXL7_9BACT|nr:hypothetical protein [Salinivirga cyanobacteriivorans]ALO14801.1 hypothetical protein L21SP5_01142 [Salinivirga cyanobacteriivorans]